MKITKTQLKQIIKEEFGEVLKEFYNPKRWDHVKNKPNNSERAPSIEKNPKMYYVNLKSESDDPRDYSTLGKDADWPENVQILNKIATYMANVALPAIGHRRNFEEKIETTRSLLKNFTEEPEAQKALELIDKLIADNTYPLGGG
jgi:hypothetical protein